MHTALAHHEDIFARGFHHVTLAIEHDRFLVACGYRLAFSKHEIA